MGTTYILHVNDPLVDRAGLIVLLGEVRGLSQRGKEQSSASSLHLDNLGEYGREDEWW